MPRDFKLIEGFREGLPDDMDLWLGSDGEVEAQAEAIIAACTDAMDRRHSPGDQWATLAFALVAWHNKHHKPMPPIVLTALAHVMGW